jgi:signal transduction histidine kinase
MQKIKQLYRRTPRLVIFLILPLAIFMYLRIFPDRDLRIWGLTWNTRLIHYYGVSFASFMALITALFAGAALGAKATARTLFITLAFSAISALLLISGITTPGVLLPGPISETFRWSLRLSLFVGALFFAIAVTPWPHHIERTIVRYRQTISLVLLLFYVLFLVIAFAFTAPLDFLTRLDPILANTLATISVASYTWAGWLTYRRYKKDNRRIDRQLAIAMILLAEAQIFMAFGVWGRLSWLLSHTLILIALADALYALLVAFQSTQQIRAAHYFGALGSIIIVGLSLIIGEVGMGFLQIAVNRSTVVTMALAQGGLSFLVLYIIVLHLDKLIAERNEALKREQHLRNELTQLIVHDLKNPLSVITSGLSLVARGQFANSPETQQSLITQLEESGQNLISLIDDLLDVERMEAGKLMPEKTAVNLKSLIGERVQAYRILAQTNKQELKLFMPSVPVKVSVDQNLIERVMNNLLANALKFTPEGGEIAVTLSLANEDVVIFVDDNGPGVPNFEREHIFEKFGQIERAERRGSGLGLTFCKMAVEAHGGSVTVLDSLLGGARFVVRLPRGSFAETANASNGAGEQNQFGSSFVSA